MALRAIDAASLFTVTAPDGVAYQDSTGALQQAPADTIIQDHKYDAGSGLWVPRGMPVFPTGQNAIPRSQDLTSLLTTSSPTVTTAGVVPLRAGSVATKINRTSQSNTRVYVPTPVMSATIGDRGFGWGIFETDPAAPSGNFNFSLFGGSGNHGAALSVTPGAPSTTNPAPTGDGSMVDHGVEDWGTGPNGGQLMFVWGVWQFGTTDVYANIYPQQPNSDPDGVGRGIIVHHWQFQPNEEVFSPPIFTNGAAVTRGAITVAALDAQSFMALDEATMLLEFESAGIPDDGWACLLYDETDDFFGGYVRSSPREFQGWHEGEGLRDIADIGSNQFTEAGTHKVAVSVHSGVLNMASRVGSGAVESNSITTRGVMGGSGKALSAWGLWLGGYSNGNRLGSYLRDARFKPRRSTVSQLEALVA